MWWSKSEMKDLLKVIEDIQRVQGIHQMIITQLSDQVMKLIANANAR
jgi:hypothetical protein